MPLVIYNPLSIAREDLVETTVTFSNGVPPAVRVFDVCARNRELVRLVVINSDPETEVTRRMRAADEDRNRPLTKAFTRAMSAGSIRQGDASIVAKLVRGLVTIAVYQAFVVAGGEDAETYRDYCADMIIAYLTPQAGVQTNQG